MIIAEWLICHCLKKLPTGQNEPQQAQPKLAKIPMSTALPAIHRVGASAKAKLMVKGVSGQLLREHTQNCFLVCSFRASASATCSYATSPA